MAATTSRYPWAPGQNFSGKAFADNVAIAGVAQFQAGQYSFLPPVTAPGTVASGGTVANPTGVDCLVYLTPTLGSITAVKLLSYNGAVATSYNVGGSVVAPAVLPVEVVGPGAIAVSYNGNLSWTWVPR